ncbi:unnamed protein product [Anisakis simplex]|uniref:Signal recognition particle 14 kDa protein n=1 Tax=Anisakis simplex TaxID=6269 RepID=A0A0M3K8K4_ANISI|nr:unnamed protein product [Anisakis simplex]
MSGALPSTGDVEWQLFSPNSIIQSQGFSNLLTLLKLSKDYAERKTAVNLLWKALNSGSEALCNWIILIFPCLIDTEIICKDEVRKQCLIALTNQHSVTPIIRFLISNCDDITVCVLSVIRQIASENINEVLLALEQIPIERCFACVMRLVLGAEISNEQKNQLIHHTITRGSYEHVQILLEFDDVIPYYMISLAEESEARNLLMLRRAELYSRDVLSTIRLDYKRCLFALCDQLVSKSFSNSLELLQNATFPRHPILLSSLYTLYSCLSEWSHNSSMPKLMGRDSLEIVKNLLNITKSVKLEDDGNFRGEEEISMNGNLADYLEWIYGSDEHCLNTFLEIWAERGRSLVTNLSVNFLVGLLPKISDDNIRYFINLFVLFADKNPSLVNEIFLVVLSLYSRADLPKIPILECIARIGVSKQVFQYVVRRALKFLLVISQQRSKSEERLKAVELVGDVWSRNENLLDEIAQLTTTVDDTKGDLKFEHAKMSLIRRICSQSDRAEEFLPRLSALSNSNGPLLADAVYAIADLCRSEVLDVSAVLKQMDTRMQNTNCEEALVAYCDLLSTSASDPEQEEVILDCIRKLWKLKSHRAAEVRAAVWRALSAFDLPEVKRALEGIEAGLVLSTCIQTIANDKQSTLLEQKIVAEEFGKFLHKMIACELEEFGRSVYTAYEGSARQQNSALLETISDFKDLASKTSEMAHLRMLSAWTISSGAESVQVKRTSAIMQHLYQLLTKV